MIYFDLCLYLGDCRRYYYATVYSTVVGDVVTVL